MASASSLTFRLFGEDISASKSLARLGAEAEATGTKFGALGAIAGKALLGIGLAAGVVGAASVDMAMKFDQQMARLSTQAHVPQAMMKGLSNSVLDLAGKVGIGPTSLAEALYHVESSFASTGITSAKAMDILKAAAEGARIGGSDLVDTQNALDAAVVSGIKGVQDYQSAMGALNATVGAGDMNMQDLAEALGTGVLAIVKNFGVTMTDASAALATFGDNNIRGALAGNQLRMAVMSLAVQAKPAQEVLGGIGIKAHQLADDMQKGGLNLAIQDLVKHLNDAGITGAKVGEFLTEAFTKKAGAGLGILVGQFDRFESKIAETNKGAHQFAQDWAMQQQQFSQQLKQLEAGFEAIGVRIGNFLIPQIQHAGKAIGDLWHSFMNQAGGNPFENLIAGFQSPGMTNFNSGIDGIAEKIGVLASKVWQQLIPAFKDVGNFITQSLWPSLQNLWHVIEYPLGSAVAGLVLAFKGFAAFLHGVLGPALVATTKWMSAHKTLVHAVAAEVLAMWAAYKGYVIVTGVITTVRGLAAAFTALDVAMNANPVGVVLIAVAALGVAVYELYVHWNAVWKAISDNPWISGTIAALSLVVAPFAVITVALVALARNWGAVWNGIKGVTMAVIDGMLVAFKGFGDGVLSMAHAVMRVAADVPGPWQHAAQRIRDSIENTKTSFDANMEGMISKTHELGSSIIGLPSSKKIEIEIRARDLATNVIAGVNSAIASIHTDVNIFEHFIGGGTNVPAPSAYGGPHRAMGGFASGWATVGEAGPEMVYLGSGGHVISNSDSRSMGGGVTVHINGPVYSDSAGIKRLMTEIDREVGKGGSVPATFRR